MAMRHGRPGGAAGERTCAPPWPGGRDGATRQAGPNPGLCPRTVGSWPTSHSGIRTTNFKQLIECALGGLGQLSLREGDETPAHLLRLEPPSVRCRGAHTVPRPASAPNHPTSPVCRQDTTPALLELLDSGPDASRRPRTAHAPQARPAGDVRRVMRPLLASAASGRIMFGVAARAAGPISQEPPAAKPRAAGQRPDCREIKGPSPRPKSAGPRREGSG